MSVHLLDLDFGEAADWGVTAERADTGDELVEFGVEAVAEDPAPGPAPDTAELPETGLLPLMFTDEITCFEMLEPTALDAARLLPLAALDRELPMAL